jgi:hypothetical protein
MKSIVVLLALFPVLPVFATDNTAAPAKAPVKSAKKAAPATKTAEPLVIPKTATPNADGSFSYTDKQGKEWRYMSTPFGVSRAAAAGVVGAGTATAAPAAQAAAIKAIDHGDTVRFEHSTPFGVTAYEKKKSDLTDDERQILESQNAAAQPAAAKAATSETHD